MEGDALIREKLERVIGRLALLMPEIDSLRATPDVLREVSQLFADMADLMEELEG